MIYKLQYTKLYSPNYRSEDKSCYTLFFLLLCVLYYVFYYRKFLFGCKIALTFKLGSTELENVLSTKQLFWTIYFFVFNINSIPLRYISCKWLFCWNCYRIVHRLDLLLLDLAMLLNLADILIRYFILSLHKIFYCKI